MVEMTLVCQYKGIVLLSLLDIGQSHVTSLGQQIEGRKEMCHCQAAVKPPCSVLSLAITEVHPTKKLPASWIPESLF